MTHAPFQVIYIKENRAPVRGIAYYRVEFICLSMRLFHIYSLLYFNSIVLVTHLKYGNKQ